MQTILLDGTSLSIEAVEAVAHHHAHIAIAPHAIEAVQRSRQFIEERVAANDIIYGVTTGFGPNADKVVPKEYAEELQRNLLISHATGVGEPFSIPITRAIMLIRLNTLLAGFSGIRLQTIELLVNLLNARIHPYIPQQGSVGASGDLCPLSHMALPLIGEGEVEYQGKWISAAEALQLAGLQPVVLSYKEGLALNNGTTVMAALGVEGVLRAERLMENAIASACVFFEALCARKQAFDEQIHVLRRHSGQQRIAEKIRECTAGSTFMGLSAQEIQSAVAKTYPASSLLHADEHHTQQPSWLSPTTLMRFAQQKITPQDAYSVRCSPQVLGASLNAIAHVREVIEQELNAVVDNPIIFTDRQAVLSGGNFHGQPIALVLDYLKLAIAEMGNLLERQICKLTDPANNDSLPDFLAENAGLHSGLMIPQYTAAALVSENKVLVHPASADSIPTSANREDHVSMGPIAGRQALEIIGNVEKILAVHRLTAAQALDLRRKQLESIGLKPQLGTGTAKAYAWIRERVSYNDADRLIYKDLQALLA